MQDNQNKNNAIYFKSLTIKNIKCFKDKHVFNFSKNENEFAILKKIKLKLYGIINMLTHIIHKLAITNQN